MKNSEVNRLLNVFDVEKQKYEQILKAVVDERQALTDGRPLSEIIILLKVKQALVNEVEILDRLVSVTTQSIHGGGEAGLSANESLCLNESIAELRAIVGRILAIERENENIILGYESRISEPELVPAGDSR